MKKIFDKTSKMCIALTLTLISCNQILDVPVKEYENETPVHNGHLLLLVIDGASGHAVKNAVNTRNAQTIRAMLDHSMYTFEGLADSKQEAQHVTLARGWANLLTGVTDNGVTVDAADLAGMTAPSLLQLAKTGGQIRTGLFASSETFYNAFATNADVKVLSPNDTASTNALITEIASSETDNFIVAQLGSVQKAGDSAGFYETGVEPTPTAEIIEAVKTVDALIAKIMKSLQARENYEKENWLVIIASSYGGDYPNSLNASAYYNYPDRNVFLMMYNARFQSSLLQRPSDDALRYEYFSPYFTGRNNATGGMHNAVMENTTFFDMDRRQAASTYENMDSTEYTIAFKMIDLSTDASGVYNGNGNHSILSKRNGTSGNGWDIRFNGQNVQWDSNNFRDGAYGSVQSGRSMRTRSNPRRTGWHTYHFVWVERPPKSTGSTDRQCADSSYIYLDGVLVDVKQGKGDQTMTNILPITIGDNNYNQSNNSSQVVITDIQFYNVALPPEFISANHCKTKIDELSEEWEYWDNLLAYYPNDRESDWNLPYIKDYSKYADDSKRLWYNKPHGSYTPTVNLSLTTQGRDISSNLCPQPDASYYLEVFNTVDIGYQTMQWLGIPVQYGTLEGLGWPIKYDYME
jgi:hypothetical protein